MAWKLNLGFIDRKLALSVMVISIIIGSIYGYKYSQNHQEISLNDTLEYYQFKSKEQQHAVRFLMQEAGINNTAQLLDSKNSNPHELGMKILEFVKSTQNHFTKRQGHQERWEIKQTLNQDASKQEHIIAALRSLNLIDAILPANTQHDAILLFGATYRTMQKRVKFLEDLYNNGQLIARYLLVLTGERYVTPSQGERYIDGSKEELLAIAQEMGKELDKLTETDLMRKILQNSSLNGKIEIIILDTQRGDLPRPTTQTTVALACQTIKNHPDIKTVIGISNQPYVQYQYEVAQRVFKENNLNLDFNVVGAQYEFDTAAEKIAQQIQDVESSLGSQIWAATPRVLDELGVNLSKDQNLANGFAEIYQQHPLVYKNKK